MNKMNAKEEKPKDLQKIIQKFETKWGKRLGELAILLYLSRKKEGAHAYELRTKVEEMIFSYRKQREKVVEHFIGLLEEVQELQHLKGENYSRVLFDLKQKLELYPFLLRNKYVRALVKGDEGISREECFRYFSELLDLLQNALEKMRSTSLLWSSISGIYPIISSLEKDGLVVLDRTEAHEGRLRKIYTITDIGREALQRATRSLLEITVFMFQMGREQEIDSEYSSPGLELPAIRKAFAKFREGLETKMQLPLNVKNPLFDTPVMNMLLPPQLRLEALTFSPFFLNPERIQQIINGIEDDLQRKLVINNLKSRFQELKKRIKECEKILENY